MEFPVSLLFLSRFYSTATHHRIPSHLSFFKWDSLKIGNFCIFGWSYSNVKDYLVAHARKKWVYLFHRPENWPLENKTKIDDKLLKFSSSLSEIWKLFKTFWKIQNYKRPRLIVYPLLVSESLCFGLDKRVNNTWTYNNAICYYNNNAFMLLYR